MADAGSPGRSHRIKSAPSHLAEYSCSETTGSSETSPSEPKAKRSRCDTAGDAAFARRLQREDARPRGRAPPPPPRLPEPPAILEATSPANPLLPWPNALGDDRRASAAGRKSVASGAASLVAAALAARDALGAGAGEFLLETHNVPRVRDQFRALEKAARSYLEASDPQLTHVRAVEKSLEHLHGSWGDCDPDGVLRSLAQRSQVKKEQPGGFLERCRVRRCGHLPGQYETVATHAILRGESMPYPGTIVLDDAQASALLEQGKPFDNMRWRTYTYAFKESSVELWPHVDPLSGPPTPFVNDAIGPDRGAWFEHRLKRNVEYIEIREGEPCNWRIRMRATRRIKPGEVILADYGDGYWKAWSETNSRATRLFTEAVHNVFGAHSRGSRCRAALWCDTAFRLARKGAMSSPHYFDGRRVFWREVAVDWRCLLGSAVSLPLGLGYEDSVGTCTGLIVHAPYRDAALERVRSSLAGGKPLTARRRRETADVTLEAAWPDDGLPYKVAQTKPRSDGQVDVVFADGTPSTVDRVVPSLTTGQWQALPRLPDGAWCRPLAWEPKNHWRLVMGASQASNRYTYDVLMDGETRAVRVAENSLEPIMLVRGSHGGTDRPPDAATWQRAYAPHWFLTRDE